jgi:hypothetical protein
VEIEASGDPASFKRPVPLLWEIPPLPPSSRGVNPGRDGLKKILVFFLELNITFRKKVE